MNLFFRISRVRFFPCILAGILLFSGCSPDPDGSGAENHVVMSLGRKVTTLDPALAADVPSQALCGAFYDTLLQYEYRSGEYRLEPAMLEKMPAEEQGGKSCLCTLRSGLYFQDSPPFQGLPKNARKVTSTDVVFSLMRLADARLNSPGYWVVRDKIQGISEFRAKTAALMADDLSVYDEPCPGFQIVDERTFRIVCGKRNPRLAYLLAMPYCSIVSRRAVEYYGLNGISGHPCGSGPFVLQEWRRDYSLEMTRNPEFREEYFRFAPDPADRKKRLPLADKITCHLVRQGVSSWLLFLQGELDFYALEDDQFQGVVGKDQQLPEALKKRGIELLRAPRLETNYIGFHFDSPKLGNNLALRRAVSLAFDKHLRVLHSGGRLVKAAGPIPPGVPGFSGGGKDPYGEKNLALAKKLLADAGYPDGIDPATGKPLSLSFDQTGTDISFQQLAELMRKDLGAIGIEVKAHLNTRPRFQEKLASGAMELFRYSWTADYPDAENFLQLFYSPNAGGCNRVCFRDPEYDRMYREIEFMPDSPERTRKYRAMSDYLLTRCPWIFESHTLSFALKHRWLKHYPPHEFAFNRWKYLSADSREREAARRSFKPLPMSELR